MRKKRLQAELFEKEVFNTNITFPVVIEYSKGRYNRGDVEAFFENGVRVFVSSRDLNSTLVKRKHRNCSNFEDEAKKEYELIVKTLVHIHKEITIDEFNRRYEEMSELNNSLDNMDFMDNIKRDEGDVNINGVVKTKALQIDAGDVIYDKKESGQESEQPF